CFKPSPLRATAQTPTARLAISWADRGTVSSSDSIGGRDGLIGIPCVFNSSSERFLRFSGSVISLAHYRYASFNFVSGSAPLAPFLCVAVIRNFDVWLRI